MKFWHLVLAYSISCLIISACYDWSGFALFIGLYSALIAFIMRSSEMNK